MRRWRVVALAGLLVALSVMWATPVTTVKGLLVDTGLTPFALGLSVDSGRVAFIDSTLKTFYVYDINSNTTTSFLGPNGAGNSRGPAIYGDKLVAAGNVTSISQSFSTVSYCVLPHAVPVQPCGAWHLIAKGLGGAAYLGTYGFPVIHGDLIAWWTFNGIAYHRISSNITETVSFPSSKQPVGLSTNGEIIAFTLTSYPGTPNLCGPLEYLDTTNESQGVVNTGLNSCPDGSTYISQYTIAFTENSTGQPRIRYHDYIRNQSSPAGTGPQGDFSILDGQAIWADRIVFSTTETKLNFDCNGDGTIGGESCLMYWNIRGPNYVASTLAAKAAPALGSLFAMYDKSIVFIGPNGHLQYVTVPMQGDVDLDGVVDVTDKTLVLNCLGQVLKGPTC